MCMSQNTCMSNLIGRTARYPLPPDADGIVKILDAIVSSQSGDSVTVQTAQGGVFADDFRNFSFFSHTHNNYVKYSKNVSINSL